MVGNSNECHMQLFFTSMKLIKFSCKFIASQGKPTNVSMHCIALTVLSVAAT